MAGHARCDALAVALSCVALFGAAVAATLALGLPSPALAADVPGNLEGMVASVVREDAEGPVAWARYVETTPEVAAELLALRRDQLYEELPERVYLVVLHGDFSLPGGGERRAPYLAFLYWRSRDTWEATDFTLLEEAVPLRSAGVPQTVQPFALRHPSLDRALLQARAALFWFLPPALLVACAALCLWKRRSRWPCTLALCALAAVALWQTFITLSSLGSQTWDPYFHGVKLAALAVVLAVELAAAYVVWRRRSLLRAAVEGAARPAPRFASVVLLLLAAAVIYVPSLFWLATTGE